MLQWDVNKEARIFALKEGKKIEEIMGSSEFTKQNIYK